MKKDPMVELFAQKPIKHELYELVIICIMFGVMGLVVPFIALFGLGGGENTANFEKVKFYFATIGFSLLLIVILRAWEMYAKKDREVYNKTGWIGAILHDPDKGLIGLHFPSMIKYFTISNVFLASLFIFSILGIYGVTQNTWFTGLPRIDWPAPQQITTTSELLLAAEPASSSEASLFIFMASLPISYLIWKYRKGQIDLITLTLLFLFVFIPVFMGLWTLFHFATHGADDTAILGTAFFGFVGGVSFAIFGTFIPWFVFHGINNVMRIAAGDRAHPGLFPDETIIIFTLTLLAIVFIMKTLIFLSSNKKGVTQLLDG